MFKDTDHNYGMTCPLLLIANEHGDDYGMVLNIADHIIHGRPVDQYAVNNVSFPALIKIVAHTVRFQALRGNY